MLKILNGRINTKAKDWRNQKRKGVRGSGHMGM